MGEDERNMLIFYNGSIVLIYFMFCTFGIFFMMKRLSDMQLSLRRIEESVTSSYRHGVFPPTYSESGSEICADSDNQEHGDLPPPYSESDSEAVNSDNQEPGDLPPPSLESGSESDSEVRTDSDNQAQAFGVLELSIVLQPINNRRYLI